MQPELLSNSTTVLYFMDISQAKSLQKDCYKLKKKELNSSQNSMPLFNKNKSEYDIQKLRELSRQLLDLSKECLIARNSS